MKRAAFLYLMIAAIASLTGCNNKSGIESPARETINYVPVTVEASVISTKVTLSGTTPLWSANDKIGVFTSDNVLCPAFTADKGGSSATTFSGQKPDYSTLCAAFFPYDADASMKSGNITLTLPGTQSGSISDAIMVATGSQESGFQFHNICSLVKFTVPSSLNIRKIEVLRDDKVSGSFTVNPNTLAISAGTPAGSSEKRVCVSSSSALSGEYVLALIPSSGKRLQMAITRADGKIALINKDFSTGKPFTAGTIKNLGTIPTSLEFFDAATVGNPVSGQMSQSLIVLPKDPPQVDNAGFETWTFDGENLPDKWNSFQTASGTLASSAYAPKNRQVKRSSDTRPGSSGSYSCSIWSRKTWGVIAQGNLTTGRVNAGSMTAKGENNYNWSDIDHTVSIQVGNEEHTNPCSMPFKGKPDSLTVWVKFVPASGNPKAKVTATIHSDFSFIDGYAKRSDSQYEVATATNQNLTSTNKKWKRLSIPFTYTNNGAQPCYLLLSFATNAVPGEGSANDYMYIDDIEMIYNRSCRLTMPSQGWASLYVDFSVKVPSSGAQVYYVTGLVNGYASLKQIPAGSVIPANTALIVKSSSSTVTFEPGTGTPVSISGNILKGTLTSKSCQSGKYYVLSTASTSGSAVFSLYNGTSLNANTAYIEP